MTVAISQSARANEARHSGPPVSSGCSESFPFGEVSSTRGGGLDGEWGGQLGCT